eukprot:g18772.t1
MAMAFVESPVDPETFSGPRSDPKKPIGARARAGSHERARPAGPTEQTCSERGWKSNPRPSPARGVPMNPLQAMKQRLAQQQHELEERRWQGRQEAEDARQARRTPASPEVSQAGCPSSARGAEVSPESSTPPEESAVEDGLSAAGTRGARHAGFHRHGCLHTKRQLRICRGGRRGHAHAVGTPEAAGGIQGAPFLSAPLAATERLRDRLKKRESGKGEFRTVPGEPARGTRSTRRTDALRRVQERREQRHQEASGLEEGSPIQAIPSLTQELVEGKCKQSLQ